eukprot:CAMPEP_0203674180 /NCGR_PEP_ID=MMETSP0090-20130426/15175_1 /ASSEMBLY_ACC=CAM_ASM_001088 /TAXON_ID=426623 /ORGANISM="Chaetoceros affinis, Strain CCMP159" /LENGTH=337 /DNA_ID=CAMNT_0050539985 /DNA_START=172 /DNA_END=1185 /DNA_ORIENTATION=-
MSSPSTTSGKSLGDTTNSSSAQQPHQVYSYRPPSAPGDTSPLSRALKYDGPRSRSTCSSTGSKNFETGKVSAFSSVAELKAHLRRNELMREERRRKRELYRQQRLVMKKEVEQSQPEEQQQQEGTIQQQQQQGAEKLPNPLLLTSDPKSNQELHHRRINFVQAPNNADLILLSAVKNQNNDDINSGFEDVPMHQHHTLQTIQEPREASVRDTSFNLGQNKVWPDHRYDHNQVSSPRSVYITTRINNDETSEITSPRFFNEDHDTQEQSVSTVSSMTRDTTHQEKVFPDRRDKKKKKGKKFSTKPLRKVWKKILRKIMPLFAKKEVVILQRSKEGNLC